MHASLAISATPAMEAVLAGDNCKVRCHSLIRIVQSFAASAHGLRSAWPLIATCQKSEAPAPRSWLPETLIVKFDLNWLNEAARFLLCVHPGI
jgi:hypothetical protein